MKRRKNLKEREKDFSTFTGFDLCQIVEVDTKVLILERNTNQLFIFKSLSLKDACS